MTYDGLSAAIIRNSRDAEAVPRSAIRRVNPVVRLPLLTAPHWSQPTRRLCGFDPPLFLFRIVAPLLAAHRRHVTGSILWHVDRYSCSRLRFQRPVRQLPRGEFAKALGSNIQSSGMCGRSGRQQTPKSCHRRNHGLWASTSSCLLFAADTSVALSGLISGASNISSSCWISSITRSMSIRHQYNNPG